MGEVGVAIDEARHKKKEHRRYAIGSDCRSAFVKLSSTSGDGTLLAGTLAPFGDSAGGSALPFGAGRPRPFALDPEQQRAGDVNRAERSGEDTEGHDPC